MTKMPLFPSVLALALIGYFGASYAAPAQNDANCTACHSNIGTPDLNMQTFRAQPAMTVQPII